ncbi:MAG: hypothetical protein FWD44_01560 [Oscillospiraceae bacterium]|nr:hypothetical protein [Oscillospiraceae bacterium]
MSTSTPTVKIVRMIVLAALAMAGGGVLYYALAADLYEAAPFALGVFATSALNVLKLRMLEGSIIKTLDMDNPEMGKNYIRLQYLVRYFITAVVLVIIGLLHVYVNEPRIISIWGALFGLFTMQIALITVRHTKLIEDEPPADIDATAGEDADTNDNDENSNDSEDNVEEIVDND